MEGSTPPTQEPRAAGWYPDPSTPQYSRWWDGSEWTQHSVFTGPHPQAPTTEAFAVVSLVLGLLGGSVLAIVFGVIARKRIDRAGGLKTGRGMATAGIILGSLWLALIAVVVALAATGVLSSENADDFSGEKRAIAQKVDDFEDAVDDNDGERVCREILTPGFAESFATRGQSCADYWGMAIDEDEVQADIDIQTIDISGDSATARAEEEGDRITFRFERRDGDWRVDGLEAP